MAKCSKCNREEGAPTGAEAYGQPVVVVMMDRMCVQCYLAAYTAFLWQRAGVVKGSGMYGAENAAASVGIDDMFGGE